MTTSFSFPRRRALPALLLLLTALAAAVVPSDAQRFRRRFCPPVMPADRKAVIKAVIGRDVFGCRISRRVALKAAKRLNWLVPKGEGAPVGISLGRGTARRDLLTSPIGPRALRQLFKILRRGRLALKRPGKLRASAVCIDSISPDIIVFWLGTTKSSKKFSRFVRKACTVSRTLETSERVVPPIFVLILGGIRRCVFIIIIFFLGGLIDFVLLILTLIWNVLLIIIIYLPCPSNPVRIAADAVKYIA